MEDEELEEMLELELWLKDKFKEWKAEKDAEMRIKMAQSGRENMLVFSLSFQSQNIFSLTLFLLFE